MPLTNPNTKRRPQAEQDSQQQTALRLIAEQRWDELIRMFDRTIDLAVGHWMGMIPWARLELRAEAMMKVWSASKVYDPALGASVSTYMHKVIRNAVRYHAIYLLSRGIGPTGSRVVKYVLQGATSRDAWEIAAETGMDPELVEHQLKRWRCVSLDAEVNAFGRSDSDGKRKTALVERIASGLPGPDTMLEDAEELALQREAISRRTVEAVARGETYQQIAEREGVTRQAIELRLKAATRRVRRQHY